MNHTQSLIIGSGPAGYTAAIYLVRSAIDCLLIEGLQVGGQLTQTTTIENFPGFPEGIDGFQLMDNMRQQAVNLGAKMKSGLVTAIDMSQRPFLVTLDGGEHLTADTLIVAGTSLSVYPAAGFLDYFRGRELVLINRDPTPADHKATLVIHDKVGKVFEQITV